MGQYNPDSNGHAWGGSNSTGALADNSQTVGMSHAELVQHLASQGVVVVTSTQGN